MSLAEYSRPAVALSASGRWPSEHAGKNTAATKSDDDGQLSRIGSRLRFGRGETIFNEGDTADFAYRVESGTVRLCKHLADGRRQIAQFLFSGDFFSFMDLKQHSFTAEAVNDVVLTCYPQRQIERLGEERSSVRKQFADLLTRRVRDTQNHLVMLGRQTAKERVASFLLVLIEREGLKGGNMLEVPMSRQDMADYLGLTIETVCRVLSALKRKGVIGIPNLHQLIIKDVHAIEALVDAEESA